jgi:threonyl-tRNA synthetase
MQAEKIKFKRGQVVGNSFDGNLDRLERQQAPTLILQNGQVVTLNESHVRYGPGGQIVALTTQGEKALEQAQKQAPANKVTAPNMDDVVLFKRQEIKDPLMLTPKMKRLLGKYGVKMVRLASREEEYGLKAANSPHAPRYKAAKYYFDIF